MLFVKHSSQLTTSDLLFRGNAIAEVLFADAPDAIFILEGSNYSIIDCNKKALELFEVDTKASIIQLPSFRLYESEFTELNQGLLEKNMRNNGEHTQEMIFRTFKQNVFWGKLVKRSVRIDGSEYIILRVSKSVDYLRTEEAMSSLLQGTARVTGKQYFKELTRLLCKTFDVKVSFVGKLSNDKTKLEIIESCGDITPIAPFNMKVEGSLVENATRGYTTFYPSGIQELFPNNKFVSENNTVGFMGTPVFGNSGEVIGLIAIMNDKPMQEVPNSRHILSFFASRTAAELYRMRSKLLLTEQAAELARANSLKDNLLSAISHDLSNPLHFVMGYSELLHKNIESYSKDDIIERVGLMDNSIKNIYFIIENIKGWLNVYNENTRPRPETISLLDVTNENLSIFKYIFALKKLQVTIEIDGGSQVQADRFMLGSIIRNLLLNAIKYTPKEGSIIIKARPVKGHIEFTVKDNGIGISPDELQFIQTQGYNINSENGKRIASNDMGLALVRKYTEWLKGTFKIDSTLEKGTLCKVILPV